ncbi:MAG: tRNA threonylcarbamoyladenosine dehydratase [Eubacteriales bacterium]|nr:tRNA threonylcarbamoyladenosine dehydratase [Eubacteriales bacterium]
MVGGNGIKILRESRICILGIGGVGSYAAEALTRCGIGNFTLIDPEDIDISNINRQIHAMENTIGRPKVEVMKERMLQINPYIHVRTIKKKYLPGSPENPDINEFSYIVDAIDDITAKADLAEKAYKEGIPMISSMGAGNKMDPSLFEAADIYDTSVCPLARAMRRELRKRGVMKLKVVYSKEEPLECGGKAPSSISFVPSAAGLVIASEVVRDLIKED